jgi:hypothetical protein
MQKKAEAIITGILKARSPRLSDIAREMSGTEAANYKSIQRFLGAEDLRSNKTLNRPGVDLMQMDRWRGPGSW